MTTEKALKELEKCGSIQNRRLYRKHGVAGELYGVSFANLNVLRRKIRKSHDMALQLWETGNHDARVLATMIADPVEITDDQINSWLKDLDNYIITDAFAGLISRVEDEKSIMEKWMTSDDEWVGRAGWQMLAILAMRDKEMPDSYFEDQLQTIERGIHSCKNNLKDSMNSALIAIGIRNEALKAKAIASAGRIGKVEVNHGKIDRNTPDAAPYIENVWKQRESKTV